MPVSSPLETRGNEIFQTLDLDISIPVVTLLQDKFNVPDRAGNELFADIERIELSTLTEGEVGSNGAFEKIMVSMRAHLQLEFEKGRITGDQYAKVYIEMLNIAMTTAVQMVMGKEQAYWQAVLLREQGKRAQNEAVSAAIGIETAKLQYMINRYQADMVEAQMVLAKAQLATEDAKYLLTHAQIDLVDQQIEIANAQHSDTRVSGGAVAGTVKRQRDLLEQQREAFIRDSDAKIAKMYLDAWSIQRTTDENFPVPEALANNKVSEVMFRAKLRADMNTPE